MQRAAAIKWNHLAWCENKLTGEFLDDKKRKCISHKISLVKEVDFDDKTALNNPALQDLLRKMRALYLTCFESVAIRPLSHRFPEDRCVSFGCFAKVFIPYGTIVSGLSGYLADFPDTHLQKDINDYSVFGSPEGNKLMEGPLSFVNSACVPNATFIPNLAENIMHLHITKESGVLAVEQI